MARNPARPVDYPRKRSSGPALGLRLSFPRLPPLQSDRDQREGDDDRDDRQEVGVDVGNQFPQRVAEQDHPDRPEQASKHVVGDEGAVLHRSDTRQDRGEGANDRYEPGENDRLDAVAIEEPLGLVNVLLLEESGVGSAKERRTHLLTERVAHLVTRYRCHKAADQDHRQVQGALGGE